MLPKRHLISAAAVLGLWAHSAAMAADVISPFAADLSFSAYSADQTAGGSAQSAFNGGYWNAGGWYTHWIQADMGTSHTLSQVHVTVGEETGYLTTQRVYLSNTPIGGNFASLTPVAEYTGVTTNGQLLVLGFTPTSGQYLQVVSTGGGGPGYGSWVALGDSSLRVDWIDPGTAPIPEPGSWALMAAGLLGVASKTRRRRV